jgi:hypothetical protein
VAQVAEHLPHKHRPWIQTPVPQINKYKKVHWI